MVNKNKYYYRSKFLSLNCREIIRYFSLDFTASDTSRLAGISIRSVNNIFLKIRHRVAEYCEQQSPIDDVVEVDESYFGARRIRGKQGRGASGKTIVFGIFNRDGRVYTEIAPNASKYALQRVIRGHSGIDSVIHSDDWLGYNGLVDLGYAKRHLVQFNGVPRHTFYLHLKEIEFRFNHRNDNLCGILLKLLRENPLFSS